MGGRLHPRHHPHAVEETPGRGHPRRTLRTPEEHLFHLPEDAPAADRTRPDVRLHRGPAGHRHDPALLYRARRRPQHLAPDPRTDQGLHRHAPPERLPVAAHQPAHRLRHALRGADPHEEHASGGGGRHRRAPGVQVLRALRRQGSRAVRLAAPVAGLAKGSGRSARVPQQPEDRSLRGRGALLHSQGRSEDAPPGRHRRGLRLRHPHRSRPRLHRRPGERRGGAASL